MTKTLDINTKPAQSIAGRRLREARLKKGFSQLQLAHKINLKGADAGSYISRLELGKEQAGLRTMMKLSTLLGVKIDWLVGK